MLEAGVGELVGTERAAIVGAALRLLGDARQYAERARASNPFGDGKASERIVEILETRFAKDAAFANL